MKRVLLCLRFLALALPTAEFANSIDVSNSGGTLNGSNAVLARAFSKDHPRFQAAIRKSRGMG